jgi:hypothetical protein
MIRTLHLLTALLLALNFGCTDPSASAIKDLNGTAIQRLANSYQFFQAKNGYQGPKNEKEFKDFIQDPVNQKGFDRAGIDNSDVEAMFVSPRDEEPFKVKYGVSGSPYGFKEAIIFETAGVEDELMVGFGSGGTELMSADEADKLFDKKAKKKITRGDSEEDIERLQENNS